MGHGFQYQFWTGFFSCDGGEFTRSTDGGVTWMNPINIPTIPYGERSTWTPTATFLLAQETEGANFGAFARQMHKTAA